MNVNKIIQEINELAAEKWSIEIEMTHKNSKTLVKEILNLEDGVGESFIPGDHYAPDRYYSNIEGVKNLRNVTRFGDPDGTIVAKITSPVGKLLPTKIKIEGKEYRIEIIHSNNYSDAVDY